MSSRLSPVGIRKLEQILHQLGFQLVRQKGSHAFYGHQDGRTTLVSVHKGEDIGRGLLRKIIKEDLKMSVEDFNKLR